MHAFANKTVDITVVGRRTGLVKPELLAPARDWDCLRAAVENGADAVYFGLDRFNARMRAHNFTVEELPKIVEYLHHRGVKGYVTFNILVFTNELPEAEQLLRDIITSGIDAAIIQDAGICRLIRDLSPDFPIHASTQMTVSSVIGIETAQELGCSMVALARECSIDEIAQMNKAISLPLEVFVHGALCVAYSGQCLTSESLGGRSANRGVCAQACRLPYELICDGRQVPMGDKRYLLSPKDLAGISALCDLIKAGVKTLKIEGRLKSPEYVANVTRVYRQEIDRVYAEIMESPHNAPSPSSKPSQSVKSGPPPWQYNLEMAFSRGLYTGWLYGINNQELVHARFGKKRGVFLGVIRKIQNEWVSIQLIAPLKPGDGVVFDSGHPDETEEGGRVYHVNQGANETWLDFGHGDVDFNRLQVGDLLWKTNDPELDKQLRRSFTGTKPLYQRPVSLTVRGQTGGVMTVAVNDLSGHEFVVLSEIKLENATQHPLTTSKLVEQLGRLGGTPFRLEQLHNELCGEVILPVSELNRLRRVWVAQLEKHWSQPNRWKLVPGKIWPRNKNPESLLNIASEEYSNKKESSRNYSLIVLVRNMAQLEECLRCGIKTIYCEFEDLAQYSEAVRMVHLSGGCQDDVPTIWLAPPRITKPGDAWMLQRALNARPDGFLVRNYDQLRFFQGAKCIGDFSLNVANPISAEWYMQRFKLLRITASYDLNGDQLADLLTGSTPSWFEVTIHQRMPLFHMEHCVFCSFLSKGTDYRNCGRPCEKHAVALRDRVRIEHPVKADAGCRNTVYNGRAQTGAEHVDRLIELGLRHFRIEFLSETAEQVRLTLSKYRQLFRKDITGGELWRDLKLIHFLGVTRGPMDQWE